jgi:hypothetical protein
MAQWLMTGFGGGRLVIEHDAPKDQYRLDMRKSRAAFVMPEVAQADIRDACIACGRKIRALAS